MATVYIYIYEERFTGYTWRVTCDECKSTRWKGRQGNADVSVHLTGRMTEGAGAGF